MPVQSRRNSRRRSGSRRFARPESLREGLDLSPAISLGSLRVAPVSSLADIDPFEGGLYAVRDLSRLPWCRFGLRDVPHRAHRFRRSL